MALQVNTFDPSIRVTLYKTVKRSMLNDTIAVSGRFKAVGETIDLTPFLGEGSSVRTSKSRTEPAGGFNITLADKAYSNSSGADTLYGIVEPMDLIEIRMSHAPAANGTPGIVMRGFVTEVGRAEGMSQNGQPSRAVTISGQDYGKLWQMLQILYLPGYVVGEDTLTAFRLFERFGAAFKTAMTGTEFLTEVLDKVLNPYVAKLMPEGSTNPTKVTIDTAQLPKHPGTTSVSGPQNREGTIYDLLRTYLDVGIWNELFVEDREDGVYCVWRAAPYKSVSGADGGDLIQADAPKVTITEVPAADIVSMNVSRSDANVANYYWVRSPAFEMIDELYRKLWAINGDKKSIDLTGYPNSDDHLYGIRVMMHQTEMGGDEVTSFQSGQDAGTQQARQASQLNWLASRRTALVEQNKDNVVLERGAMRIRGNEAIRAGTYVRLVRGQFTADYYVTQVAHEYVPFNGFFTTLALERGRGFIERAQRDGGSSSPYYSELS